MTNFTDVDLMSTPLTRVRLAIIVMAGELLHSSCYEHQSVTREQSSAVDSESSTEHDSGVCLAKANGSCRCDLRP